MKKNKQILRDLWGSVTCIKVHVMGILEGEERESTERIFEGIMAINSPNLRKDANLHISGSSLNPRRINAEIHTKTHCHQTVETPGPRAHPANSKRGSLAHTRGPQ